jgi:hypothetical protein
MSLTDNPKGPICSVLSDYCIFKIDFLSSETNKLLLSTIITLNSNKIDT